MLFANNFYFFFISATQMEWKDRIQFIFIMEINFFLSFLPKITLACIIAIVDTENLIPRVKNSF